jgi:hypothetical protein
MAQTPFTSSCARVRCTSPTPAVGFMTAVFEHVDAGASG